MPNTPPRRDTASRLIHAPPSVVYDAFVQRDAVIRWLPPGGARMEIAVFEPHVGGRFEMTLFFESAPGKSSATTDVVKGRFVDLVPGERVVQRFTFESSDPAFAGEMTMRWAFEPAPGGTMVTVSAVDVPPGISAGDHEAGMRSSLEHLAAHVE